MTVLDTSEDPDERPSPPRKKICLSLTGGTERSKRQQLSSESTTGSYNIQSYFLSNYLFSNLLNYRMIILE